ncbi:Immunity protein 26 [Anaerocolumna jejuensis DSM 15929]|uniref:Immunity protein 26 n=1 Tax=Anaerocolumna jejuensis DSM 15929 TaxID=1121322 RepID=A0A1M6JPE2_9FIRM|nr:Imm26 family immunity protein [Anaerocolumna jejuensis]SHJ48518.1 Immunity protein 26 [Anaerocolumna jejuensis DSM 15929]
MAKIIKYKIGDLFIVPLVDNLKGVGRVLNKNEDTILIELYKMKPITNILEFDYESVSNEKPIVIHWCYDDGIKKGIWEVFDNKPVLEEIEMPYFWYDDSGYKKYFISKGEWSSYRIKEDSIEIAKEDTNKYEPYGIGNEISERNRYIRRLCEKGLIN